MLFRRILWGFLVHYLPLGDSVNFRVKQARSVPFRVVDDLIS